MDDHQTSRDTGSSARDAWSAHPTPARRRVPAPETRPRWTPPRGDEAETAEMVSRAIRSTYR